MISWWRADVTRGTVRRWDHRQRQRNRHRSLSDKSRLRMWLRRRRVLWMNVSLSDVFHLYFLKEACRHDPGKR